MNRIIIYIILITGSCSIFSCGGGSSCPSTMLVVSDLDKPRDKLSKGQLDEVAGGLQKVEDLALLKGVLDKKRLDETKALYAAYHNCELVTDASQLMLLMEPYQHEPGASVATAVLAFKDEDDFQEQKALLEQINFARKSTPWLRTAAMYETVAKISFFNLDLQSDIDFGDITLYATNEDGYIEATAYSVEQDGVSGFLSGETFFIIIGFFADVN